MNDDEGINVLGIIHRGHKYIYIYHNHHLGEVIRRLGRTAGDPGLNLDWRTAARAAVRAQKLVKRSDTDGEIMPNHRLG